MVARIRKQLAAQTPKLPRGRPQATPAAPAPDRRAKTIQQRVAELFEHRHLFVRHHLTAAQRARCGSCAAASRNCGRCARSWTRCTGCSTAAAGRTRPDEVGQVAPAGAAVPQPGQEPGQVEDAQSGEGTGVPGRQAAGGDEQRGGTGQPPLPQDAEDRLPGSHPETLKAGWPWTSSAISKPAGVARP